MAALPQGMLSLTYHLAYDEDVRSQWLNNEFGACFAAFGITDPALQKRIRDLNNGMGGANDSVRDQLIDQWMTLVGDDIRASAANPLVLW